MKDFSGRVALVTGGSSGIGLSIVETFARAGMKVAFTYRSDDHRDEALRALASFRGAVHAIRADVTDRAAMTSAVEETERVLGNLHVLVNNAAAGVLGPTDRATEADWRWMMEVNLFGVLHGISAALPRLRAHGEGGHIMNVGSIALSYLTGPGVGMYTTSKFALRGLTECLRYDLARDGIGVSLLCPGLTRTNIHESAKDRTEPAARMWSHPRIHRDLAALYAMGMDPMEVGRAALAGMVSDAPLIFTHPEHNQTIRESCDELLAALPVGDVPPERAATAEQARIARYAASTKRPPG